LERVASQLSKIECDKLLCVMGFCEDKDIKSILALMPTTAHYIFTRANSRRAAKTETLAALATELNLDFECCDDVKSAVEFAKSKMGANDALYIGGSTFVVAEVLEREE
jgi:dihydrofolate synthase/folylpolyglutamate synthase